MKQRSFAARLDHVSGAAVKDIISMMVDPSITSFGGGSPANESFPIAEIKEIVNQVLTDSPYELLQYGKTEGYLPLREAYLEHIVLPKGVRADVQNVITVSGGTQGFDLATQAFVDPGDVVLLESPTYLTVFNVLRKLGAEIVAVKTDENGIRIDDLEEKIQRYHPKMLYAIPTFQNPTGRTLPVERRKRIAELAGEYNLIVAEDDPYCELRYRGEALPPIKSFDTSGNVIMLSSFSKTISPGIRVGALVADHDIIEKMTDIKQCSDTHSTNLTQAICAEYLKRGLLPGHIESIRPMYLARMNAMLDGIRQYFPKNIRYTDPDGGLFTWVELPGKELPGDVDTRVIVKESVAKIKVGFVPGSPFFLDPAEGKNCLRLNFSSNTPEKISAGIKSLGDLLCEIVR
jgi:2-aminoadipate transaminase